MDKQCPVKAKRVKTLYEILKMKEDHDYFMIHAIDKYLSANKGKVNNFNCSFLVLLLILNEFKNSFLSLSWDHLSSFNHAPVLWKFWLQPITRKQTGQNLMLWSHWLKEVQKVKISIVPVYKEKLWMVSAYQIVQLSKFEKKRIWISIALFFVVFVFLNVDFE